jgi:hypothetical protein
MKQDDDENAKGNAIDIKQRRNAKLETKVVSLFLQEARGCESAEWFVVGSPRISERLREAESAVPCKVQTSAVDLSHLPHGSF